jgi:hypothetical protein
VYHYRVPSERAELVSAIEKAAKTDEMRLEVDMARRTIADEIRDEGRVQGEVVASRRFLLRQLRQRFGDLPPALESRIEATENSEQLLAWFDRVMPAKTLADVGIPGAGNDSDAK